MEIPKKAEIKNTHYLQLVDINIKTKKKRKN